MWQRLHAEVAEVADVVAVAVDAQGPSVVLPWVERGGVTFPVLVDARGEVPAALGISVVRTFAPLGPDGRLAHPPVKVHASEPETFAAIRSWLLTGSVADLAPVDRGGAPPSSAAGAPARAQSRAWLELAGIALDADRRGDAEAALREAVAADPSDAIARKQLWAVTHPERFYGADIDTDWQREQARGG